MKKYAESNGKCVKQGHMLQVMAKNVLEVVCQNWRGAALGFIGWQALGENPGENPGQTLGESWAKPAGNPGQTLREILGKP